MRKRFENIYKLPPYEVLKQEFLAGATHSQLARKYGCSDRAVHSTLRRRATLLGEWPLLSQQERARRATAELKARARNVDPLVIRSLLIEHMSNEGLTIVQFARRHGLSPLFVRDVRSRSRTQSLSYRAAAKILLAIDEPVPEWMLDAEAS